MPPQWLSRCCRFGQRTFADTHDDRERITRERQAAEALFSPKPAVSTSAVPNTPPTDQSARKPRVLRITSPSPARHEERESPATPAPPAREIPRSQFARIRSLAGYGLTVAQTVSEVERILRQI